MIRKILLAALIFLLAAFAALYWYMRPLPILTVTSWAGDYGHAQAVAQMHPYAAGRPDRCAYRRMGGASSPTSKAM